MNRTGFILAAGMLSAVLVTVGVSRVFAEDANVRTNVDVDCRCPDPVGQNFCSDFKQQVGKSSAYRLVDNLNGYGLGVHFTCVDMWKGINAELAGHMSAVSVAFTLYSDTLPGEIFEDNSVFRVGVEAVPEMSRRIVTALGQLVSMNSSFFERLRGANGNPSEEPAGSGETSGASTGSAGSAAPSAAPSAAAPGPGSP
ncbi:MAG: hypothetical protein IVW54_11085 [Candidatus Binataceae bacterium]|nr:hypothetical protein [Candidatus Binataceae bacterium]